MYQKTERTCYRLEGIVSSTAFLQSTYAREKSTILQHSPYWPSAHKFIFSHKLPRRKSLQQHTNFKWLPICFPKIVLSNSPFMDNHLSSTTFPYTIHLLHACLLHLEVRWGLVFPPSIYKPKTSPHINQSSSYAHQQLHWQVAETFTLHPLTYTQIHDTHNLQMSVYTCRVMPNYLFSSSSM